MPCCLLLSCGDKWPSALSTGLLQPFRGSGWGGWLQRVLCRKGLHTGSPESPWCRLHARVSCNLKIKKMLLFYSFFNQACFSAIVFLCLEYCKSDIREPCNFCILATETLIFMLLLFNPPWHCYSMTLITLSVSWQVCVSSWVFKTKRAIQCVPTGDTEQSHWPNWPLTVSAVSSTICLSSRWHFI